ncbi:MAG: hypothetical protein OSJ73_01585 [Lachnospiraceae bacterium]|nr:hypothetical protein [Lachnospiraceae bacterium]
MRSTSNCLWQFPLTAKAALRRSTFHAEKRKGQRFSFLFEPPKGGMGDFCKISTDL